MQNGQVIVVYLVCSPVTSSSSSLICFAGGAEISFLSRGKRFSLTPLTVISSPVAAMWDAVDCHCDGCDGGGRDVPLDSISRSIGARYFWRLCRISPASAPM
ncbi:hypothetical protein KCP77_12720 [Salmonella enterica subsp. enterica]|nr:hypothetical protein KCP77_12720 [Salmonella enterica subsp. enterica]